MLASSGSWSAGRMSGLCSRTVGAGSPPATAELVRVASRCLLVPRGRPRRLVSWSGGA